MQDVSNMLVLIEAIFGDHIVLRLIQYVRFIVVGPTAMKMVEKDDPFLFVDCLKTFAQELEKVTTS